MYALDFLLSVGPPDAYLGLATFLLGALYLPLGALNFFVLFCEALLTALAALNFLLVLALILPLPTSR